jgi:hypothetical protein
MWEFTHHYNLHPPISQFIFNNPTSLHTGTASLHEDIHVHAMKADWGSRGIAPLILKLCTRLEVSAQFHKWATLASDKSSCTH